MLSDRRVHTTLPTSDVDALRPFYEDVLGLTPQAILPGAVFYEVGEGTRFAISRSGIPSAGSHTQMAFTVPDVDAEVAALTGEGHRVRGVRDAGDGRRGDRPHRRRAGGLVQGPGGQPDRGPAARRTVAGEA